MIRQRLLPSWFFVFLLILGIVTSLTRCTKDVAQPRTVGQVDTAACDTLLNGFSQDIAPIFSNNCATSGCHNSSSSAHGITLETHSQIKSETKNGKVLCSIKHKSGCTNMPSGSPKLSEDKIRMIECWAQQGYSND